MSNYRVAKHEDNTWSIQKQVAGIWFGLDTNGQTQTVDTTVAHYETENAARRKAQTFMDRERSAYKRATVVETIDITY